MFKRILIANRGEIAIRIIRACQELGVEAVAVYSEDDKDAAHAKMADLSICIGPANLTKSYLNIVSILSAAKITGCDAIHPGYGFLAENADFAAACEEHQITFIGPHVQAIRAMGDKLQAREMVQRLDIPVIPGGSSRNPTLLLQQVEEKIGFPILVKAVAGGGGKGMRVIREARDFLHGVEIAQREAAAAFSRQDVYVEKYLEEPRHIEIQVLADNYGNAIHLGERDCSIQRRHQKLIEEAPSLDINPVTRNGMYRAALRIVKEINYTGAGTVEFLLDSFNNFYFIEMNTRIQVEHPVTEMVTGLDLVKLQIKIAAGEKLPYTQKDIKVTGHAIECRINAEDPWRKFMPSCGTILAYQRPGGPGIRVDDYIYPGYNLSPKFDSLLAKVIAWGADRQEAICRMKRALREIRIEGLSTTVPFLQQILDDAEYQRGEVYTTYIPKKLAAN